MSSTQEAKSLNLESKLKRMEDIVTQMESGQLSLDDMLLLFEEGVKLSKECQVQLHVAEQKVEQLLDVNEMGEAQTVPLSPQ